MKKTLAGLLCAAALLSFSTPILQAEDAASKPAAQDAGNADKRADKFLARFKKKLELSDEQVAKLKVVWTSHQEAMKPVREKLKTALVQLRAEVKSKASDAEIAATLVQLKAGREEMRVQTEKTLAAAEGILTPSQQAKVVLHFAKQRLRLFGWLRGKAE